MKSARDYEDCVDRVQSRGLASEEASGLIAGCGARFAGRRKPDGGYSYYDFMQDKKFDIAGPNPSRTNAGIDREYIGCLEVSVAKPNSEALANAE